MTITVSLGIIWKSFQSSPITFCGGMPFVFYLFRPLKHRNQMCWHHWSMLKVTQHQQNCKVTNQLCHLNSNKPNLCNQMLILQVFAPSQHNTTQHHKTPAQQQINPTKLFSINVTQCIETVTMTFPSFETTLLSPQPSSKHTSSEKYVIQNVISMTTIYFVTSNLMQMVLSIRSLCFFCQLAKSVTFTTTRSAHF